MLFGSYRGFIFVKSCLVNIAGGGNLLIFRYLEFNRFTSDGNQRRFGAISAAFFCFPPPLL